MKLKVTFSRTEKVADVEAIIEVVDRGDYPITYVFNGTSDYPENEGFQLKSGWSRHIKKTTQAQHAAEWASRQVQAIKEKILEWRSYAVPEDYYVEI